jgi:hypothetical protein
MGKRSLILVAIAATACDPVPPASGGAATTPKAATIADRVAADFEAAVKTSKEAYVALFDFVAVGEMEILLHRYDVNGRDVGLTDAQKAQFTGEDGTPYPEARERRNVGNFYTFLAQRTVGSGGCSAHPPSSHYGTLLGQKYEPLPAGTPPGYEVLRTHANEWLDHGGVVGITCTGGEGGLAVVYTAKPGPRGYDLITIYDDE